MENHKMSSLRWKAQALLFHRNLTAENSHAADQGLLPVYAHLAYTIAANACAVAGLARKSWRDADKKALTLSRIRSLRSRINTAFDQLEATLQKTGKPVSAIRPDNKKQASENSDKHGNIALLALSALEDAGNLATPLMHVASGEKSLSEAKPEIEFSSADVRVNLHIICENARVCPETSTRLKWMLQRDRYPETFFQVSLPSAEIIAARRANTNYRGL